MIRGADGRPLAEAVLDAGKATGSDRPAPSAADDVDGVDTALEAAWTALADRRDKASFKAAMRAALRMQHAAQHGDDEAQESDAERKYE